MNYYNEKFSIESQFKSEADSILNQAKEAWDHRNDDYYNGGANWEDTRHGLLRRLEAAKSRAIEAEAAMFDNMAADIDRAHAKPLSQGQSANLQAVALVGVNRDNAAAAFESVKGNAMGVSTLCDMAKDIELSDLSVSFHLPVKPMPPQVLKDGLRRVQENRKERILRYGGYGDIHTSGAVDDFFMPEGKDKRMTAAQEFLDEYGA